VKSSRETRGAISKCVAADVRRRTAPISARFPARHVAGDGQEQILKLLPVCASALLICLLVLGCDARPDARQQVDQLFAQWDKPDSPGAAVVIIKDGAVVYERGYGCANLEQRIPITPQTRFDVASVAKQFTGLSVAMLMQQGKLSPDDDVHKYLPDVPDFGKPITIANLLCHTSGLRDWPETLGLSGVGMEDPITLDMILEMVRRQRELDFAPGEEHLYSNTGYNVLAAVVARITGQSFRSWTGTNLFEPLGMRSTFVCDNAAEPVPNRADSYVPADRGKFRRVASQLSAQGSSSLFITADDMGKWLLNFEAARVGRRAAVERMQQPGKLNNGAKVNYGFGLVLGQYHGMRMISHGGSWAGYRSAMLCIPEKRFAVAILSNTSDMNTGELAYKIAALYLEVPPQQPSDQSPTNPPAVKPDPASWDAFPGTYRLGPGWLLTITREGNQLMTQATHEDKFVMTSVSETNFFVEAYRAPIEFVRQPSGRVTNLLYRGINAPRLDPPVLALDKLPAYAGDYWSEELRIAGRIEIHDGKLASQQRSGTWLYLLPTGADRFDTEWGGMAIEFTRNSASNVTEMRISGSRVRHLRYTKVTFPKAKP
jgi:CubicO group peptidase (beta-lactamase class C family)